MFSTFLTTEEVAQMIGVKPARVRELALSGNIRALRPEGARRWRFTKQAVADYMGVKKEEIL